MTSFPNSTRWLNGGIALIDPAASTTVCEARRQ